MAKNVTTHKYKLDRKARRVLRGHNSFLVLFTGLSGSGKSTIANALEQELHNRKISTIVLDGDNIRSGINKDLSFSPTDRSENIRRIGEISKLLIDSGVVVLAAFVAPYAKDREFVRNTVGPSDFIEVFVNTSLETCQQRDVKGLYAKAREGIITNMTGVTAPYEKPLNPDIEITEKISVNESVALIFDRVKDKLQLPEDE